MSYFLPILIALLIIYALIKKVNVYSAFVRGAGNALPVLKEITPLICAIMISLSLLRSSGALEIITNILSPLLNTLGIDKEIAPLFILRPFSGSASLALLSDIFSHYGVDTFIGFLSSIMMGSTETIFYTIALYFGAAGIKKTRYAVPVALISSIVGVYVAVIVAKYLFYK